MTTQVLPPQTCLYRHRHAQSYLAFVMQGAYGEFGDRGSWRIEEGMIVAHSSLESHRNVIGHAGATIVNIDTPFMLALPAVFLMSDFDEALRHARHRDFVGFLARNPVKPVPRIEADWQDILAKRLRGTEPCRLAEWASDNNLAAATVSRGFRAKFGISPERYRVEVRAARAVSLLAETRMSSVDIADASGFSDQSHMCRDIKQLYGVTPIAIRTSNRFKTVRID
jgi:AraC-like DNA-binding protein